MKKLFLKASLVFLLLLASQFSIANQNNEELSPVYKRQVSVIKGSQLPMLLGKSFENFSLMVFQDNSFIPVPFQFDDTDEKGFPYVPGGIFEIAGSEGILEEQDELVFMLKDTGQKAPKEAIDKLEGKILAEISFQINEVSRYAYIVEGNSERSEKHYAHFNQETGLISTDKYTLQTKPDDILIWSDLTYVTYQPNTTIFDTMKLRIRAKLGFIKATIHNDLIPTKVLAVKKGSVRSLVSVEIKIAILGIKLAKAASVMTFSEEGFTVPVYADIPAIAATLSDLSMDVSMDFNAFNGAKVRTALGPKQAMIVGSDAGAKPEEQKISLEDSWLAGTTGKGFDIYAFFLTYGDFKPKLEVLYRDAFWGDKPDKPERFKGPHPEVGYHIKDVPHSNELLFSIQVGFGDDLWDYGLDKTMAEIKTPVQFSVQ